MVTAEVRGRQKRLDFFLYFPARALTVGLKTIMKFLLLALAGAIFCDAMSGAELRLGIIGCDTSHVIAFTETLNNPEAKSHIPGGKIVGAYKGGSKDIKSSWSRVEEYSKTLREKYGV